MQEELKEQTEKVSAKEKALEYNSAIERFVKGNHIQTRIAELSKGGSDTGLLHVKRETVTDRFGNKRLLPANRRTHKEHKYRNGTTITVPNFAELQQHYNVTIQSTNTYIHASIETDGGLTIQKSEGSQKQRATLSNNEKKELEDNPERNADRIEKSIKKRYELLKSLCKELHIEHKLFEVKSATEENNTRPQAESKEEEQVEDIIDEHVITPTRKGWGEKLAIWVEKKRVKKRMEKRLTALKQERKDLWEAAKSEAHSSTYDNDKLKELDQEIGELTDELKMLKYKK
jgi:hypothetical protein